MWGCLRDVPELHTFLTSCISLTLWPLWTDTLRLPSSSAAASWTNRTFPSWALTVFKFQPFFITFSFKRLYKDIGFISFIMNISRLIRNGNFGFILKMCHIITTYLLWIEQILACFHPPQRYSGDAPSADSHGQRDRRPSGGSVHQSLPLQGETCALLFFYPVFLFIFLYFFSQPFFYPLVHFILCVLSWQHFCCIYSVAL